MRINKNQNVKLNLIICDREDCGDSLIMPVVDTVKCFDKSKKISLGNAYFHCLGNFVDLKSRIISVSQLKTEKELILQIILKHGVQG